MTAGTAPHGGAAHGGNDHCVDGFAADPADATLTAEPQQWVASNGDVDLLLPMPVLDWMHRNHWMEAHDAWHNVRRCNSFLSFPDSPTVNICDEHPDLVATHQECSGTEDGYAFLVEHRHMIDGFKQAFPRNVALFEGFEKFPFDAADVPEPWRARFGTGWSQQIVSAAQKMEDIENRLSEFPSEGALGQFFQCGGMGPMGAVSSIHTAMHFKWTVEGSPYELVDQVVDLGNYMFWKLHGWIDGIWERYRVAKGLAPHEPLLSAALLENCREMERLAALFDESDSMMAPGNPGPGPTRPAEQGAFHETVRPILNSMCSGCHSGAAPVGGLSFAETLSSASIVSQLVDVPSNAGGAFARVVPGQPEQSWLYLKVSDMAKSAGCTGNCNAQSMPPTGRVELSSDQLSALSAWIQSGAPAPTAQP
jgi:hypothetical protein